MSAPSNTEAPYYRDIQHNLGYKPIVRASVELDAYAVRGWRQVPIAYYDRVWDDIYGWIIEGRSVFYEHLDENTVRFYGAENMEITVSLYLEPRRDAWYG